MSKYDIKAESKKGAFAEERNFETLQLGCMMRIADALEILTKKYEQLEDDRNWYQKAYRERQAKIDSLASTITVYKGHCERYRRKIANLQQRITDLELEKAK